MEENLPLAKRMDQRLTALRQELQAGQKMLVDLDARRLDVQQTLLRIGGAVQVLGRATGGGTGRGKRRGVARDSGHDRLAYRR